MKIQTLSILYYIRKQLPLQLLTYKDKWIIELIFRRYAAGASIPNILEELKEKGAKTLRIGGDFRCSNITAILRNEVYCGDRDILKTPARNYLTKKIDPTIKQESYYVQDHHEAIISRQLWNSVQERLIAEQSKKDSGERSRKDHHPYFNRIICASCGQPYRRCIWKNRRGENVPMWKCASRYKGECYARIVREDELAEAMSTAEKIKVTEFDVVAC